MQRHRVLIVDDEEPIVFSMSRYFASHGFDVDSARELEEAQALLLNVPYSAVIADLRLTGVHGAEGLELLAYVRERCPGTRTLLLTAYSSTELEAVALSRGADAVLRKPKPLAELLQIVADLVKVHS